MDQETDAAKRRQVVEWLNSLFPDLGVPAAASSEELRARLYDGTVLCGILNRLNAGSLEIQTGAFISSEQRLNNVKRFLSAIEQMDIPRFSVSDLEKGPISGVVQCLLHLRNHLNSSVRGNGILDGQEGRQNSMAFRGERRSQSESKLQQALRNPVISGVGHNFHEVFQLKQGRYSDLPAAKISELMKSNSLDNAPTQSLLSVMNGILDESSERKNGEIPHRVACLLRKVVQEIERRISTQAEHIRNQNNLIKAREEKYQSRIRVLETLATGTSEETQIVTSQLNTIKTEKKKIEENQQLGNHDMDKLMKEKETSDHVISDLKQELEMTNKTYKQRCQQVESKANETKRQLEERIKEVELLLAESRKKTKELEVGLYFSIQNISL